MAKRHEMEDEVDSLDNYDDLLDRSFDDIPMPKDVPLTKYVAVCDGISFVKPKKEGTNPKVLAFFQLVSPVEALDDDAQAELGEGYEFSLNRYAKTIWIGEGRDWKTLMELIDALGVDRDGLSINQAMKSAKGKEAVVSLKRGRPYTDDEGHEQQGGIEVGRVDRIADAD